MVRETVSYKSRKKDISKRNVVMVSDLALSDIMMMGWSRGIKDDCPEQFQ